ncbi:MAG: hypothetical protein Kow0092_12690 [Deferrisomatales bacterium]
MFFMTHLVTYANSSDREPVVNGRARHGRGGQGLSVPDGGPCASVGSLVPELLAWIWETYGWCPGPAGPAPSRPAGAWVQGAPTVRVTWAGALVRSPSRAR